VAYKPDDLDHLARRLAHADQWRLGVFGCSRCDQSWTDELPPLWWDEWPTCIQCQSLARLIEPLPE
jgi:hypothetical protein